MGLTHFPNGASSFGMPALGTGPLMTTGNVFFVDSGAGAGADSPVSNGKNPVRPFLTIDYAIGQCAANNGDIIFVMPGHTESLSAPGDITINVAGVTVMGLGQGNTRPKVTHDSANGRVSIIASNTRWSNIIHVASEASVSRGVHVWAGIEHSEIDHCHFTFDETGVEFSTAMIKVGNGGASAAADDTYIHDNWFQAENIDGAGSAILLDDVIAPRIINNLFTGDFNSVTIDGAAGSSAVTDYVIVGNVVENIDTGLTIDLDDSATGVAFNNSITGGGAIADIADWGDLLTAENYVCDAADTSGIVIPSTASA